MFNEGDHMLVSSHYIGIDVFSSQTPDGEGNFTFGGEKFLCVRMKKNNEYYFGYIKIERQSNLAVLIHEWAMHKIPDTPLLTGEKD